MPKRHVEQTGEFDLKLASGEIVTAFIVQTVETVTEWDGQSQSFVKERRWIQANGKVVGPMPDGTYCVMTMMGFQNATAVDGMTSQERNALPALVGMRVDGRPVS